MKYCIETIEDGCVETLTLDNGKQYKKTHNLTSTGIETKNNDFYEMMEIDGMHSEEILDEVCDLFDNLFPYYFLELARKDGWKNE